jgi:hypothetical protein
MLVGNLFSIIIGVFLALAGKSLWWHDTKSLGGYLGLLAVVIIARFVVYYHVEAKD